MQFRADALRLVDEISRRGALPLLVGGTMLYFKALRDGLDDAAAGRRPRCARRWTREPPNSACRRCMRELARSIRLPPPA